MDCSVPDRHSGGSGTEDSDLRLPPTLLVAPVSVDLNQTEGSGDLSLLASLVCPDTVTVEQNSWIADHQSMTDCDRLCDAARRVRTGVRVI